MTLQNALCKNAEKEIKEKHKKNCNQKIFIQHFLLMFFSTLDFFIFIETLHISHKIVTLHLNVLFGNFQFGETLKFSASFSLPVLLF